MIRDSLIREFVSVGEWRPLKFPQYNRIADPLFLLGALCGASRNASGHSMIRAPSLSALPETHLTPGGYSKRHQRSILRVKLSRWGLGVIRHAYFFRSGFVSSCTCSAQRTRLLLLGTKLAGHLLSRWFFEVDGGVGPSLFAFLTTRKSSQ